MQAPDDAPKDLSSPTEADLVRPASQSFLRIRPLPEAGEASQSEPYLVTSSDTEVIMTAPNVRPSPLIKLGCTLHPLTETTVPMRAGLGSPSLVGDARHIGRPQPQAVAGVPIHEGL